MMDLKWVENLDLSTSLNIGPLIDIRVIQEGEERCCSVYIGAQPDAVRGIKKFHYCWDSYSDKDEHEIRVER